MADAVARRRGVGHARHWPGPSGTRLVAFYHGVMAEMSKVTWPDFPQVRSATIAIIIFVLAPRAGHHDSRFRASGHADQGDSVALRGTMITMANTAGTRSRPRRGTRTRFAR